MVIDSDIVVSASLEQVLERAWAGKIVAARPGHRRRGRAGLPSGSRPKLRAPLRREDWVHNGFVVFSTDHWPGLLERWWELCELVPPEQAFQPGPFNAPEFALAGRRWRV